MRVLRAGGQYAATREWQLWFALGAILLVALGAAILMRSLVVALAVTGAALLATKPVRRQLASVRKGRLGEESITELLGRLSDDYFLVNDVTLPGLRGNIDHILIGPCGVVVIETKRIAGEIKCLGNY